MIGPALCGFTLTVVAATVPSKVVALAPPTGQAVPFKVGETLEYDVGWSSYLTAGTATLAIREKKPSYGSVAYYAVAEGRATGLVAALYHVYYKADTLLDVYRCCRSGGPSTAKRDAGGVCAPPGSIRRGGQRNMR